MIQTMDFRNARYQGKLTKQGMPHQRGIIIDDNICLYTSQWRQNKLNGKTLVYFSHAKYLYGQWNNNNPNGLNIFRSGDTVLISQFKNGYPIGLIMTIFEKYKIVAILQNQNGQIKVVSKSKLINHQQLVSLIQQLGFNFPNSFYSLTKFMTTITNQSIIIAPNKEGNCYFGFNQGLGIVINPNNGIVTIGHHQKGKLYGFGAKFSRHNVVEEGNFQTKQLFAYKEERPLNSIYPIYQKMHKCSLNFCNKYFDSKTKIFKQLQQLLRNKINDIAIYKPINCNKNQYPQKLYEMNNTFRIPKQVESYRSQFKNQFQINNNTRIRKQIQVIDLHIISSKELNDSLDYQQQEDGTIQAAQNRRDIYQADHNTHQKNLSTSKRQVINSIKKQFNYQKSSPSTALKHQSQDLDLKGKQPLSPFIRNKKRVDESDINNQLKAKTLCEFTPRKDKQNQFNDSQLSEIFSKKKFTIKQSKQLQLASQISRINPTSISRFHETAKKYMKKQSIRQEQVYTFQDQDIKPENKDISQPSKNSNHLEKSNSPSRLTEIRERKRSKSPAMKPPVYEGIEERRQRLLKEFKNLNAHSFNTPISKSSANLEKSKKQFESPYLKENISDLEKSQRIEVPSFYMPISISQRDKELGQSIISQNSMPAKKTYELKMEKKNADLPKQSKEIYGSQQLKKLPNQLNKQAISCFNQERKLENKAQFPHELEDKCQLKKRKSYKYYPQE